MSQGRTRADHGQTTIPPPPTPTFSAREETNHIKIMLATDNHVGFMERDPVRGQDSIRTFEEILKLSVEHEVDLILLGGDLFHENKPSRPTLHQVMALLRQYTLGDRPVQVELLSDPCDGALEGYDFPAINYEDSNLNVSIPVFSIHGNHDDPQGTGETGALSALDILSVSGLINYFGKIELPSDDSTASAPSSRAAKGGFQEKGIRIRPVLLQKGETKIALYGMGNIKDERMHFELRSNRVRMFRPAEDPDDWFNILCVHQNRAAHNPKACVPETMFDDSIHLVVWGHEHEQLINPQPVTEKRYHISQPGSSIATSLCPGEAVEKCVAIVHVEKTDFMIEPIPLKTVRPFVMDDMVLSEELEENGLEPKREDIIKLLKKRVQALIEKAKAEWLERYPDHDGGQMPLPLVRLRVEYSTQELSNPQRFGQEFAGKVANPKDVLQFHRKKGGGGSVGANDRRANAYVDVSETSMMPSEKLERVEVGALVQEYLQAQNLDILNPEGLEGAVLNFVEKDDRDAIDSFVQKMLRTTVKGLVTLGPDEKQIEGELERLRALQVRVSGLDRGEREDEEESANAGGRGGSRGGRREVAAGSKGRANASAAHAVESDDSMLEEIQVEDGGDASDPFEDEGRPPTNRTKASSTRSRGAVAASSRSTKAAAPASTSSSARRGRKATSTFLGNSEESDVEDSVPPTPTNAHAAALGLPTGGQTGRRAAPAKRAATTASRSGSAATRKPTSSLRQSQLDFGSSRRSRGGGDGGVEEEEEEEDGGIVELSQEQFRATTAATRSRRSAATGRRGRF
ncbi:DNA repair exonuclease [Violaceomyces palustris]|uniref:DNA repair exonuclease n=1 Tax=Violaceomyces palustris TaxID=1673888 RepID=A0ACD0NRH8_9BASI|nr:DNA repair exonuclease [Violaceomyces palustris]